VSISIDTMPVNGWSPGSTWNTSFYVFDPKASFANATKCSIKSAGYRVLFLGTTSTLHLTRKSVIKPTAGTPIIYVW